MDQTRAREMAKDAAEQAGKTATDAAKRVGEQVQPAFDQGKAVVQDLANQASEVGRQAVDRAGEFVEGLTPNKPAGRHIQRTVFGIELVNRRAAAHGVAFAEDLLKIAVKQFVDTVIHKILPWH